MYTHALMGILGGQEIILILIIVLVLFGGRKIPELMRGLGKGMAEYKKAKDEVLDNDSPTHDSERGSEGEARK